LSRRVAAVRSLAELREDLLRVWEAPGLVLGEDPLPVDLDVEDPVVSLDEDGLDAGLLLDPGRQTGGLREVVSANAVGDRDPHAVSLGSGS
jgi:hypothetical protein